MCSRIDCESSPLRTARTPEIAPMPIERGQHRQRAERAPAEEVDRTEGDGADRDRPVRPHAGKQGPQQHAAEQQLLEDRRQQPGGDGDDGELGPGRVEEVVDDPLVLVDQLDGAARRATPGRWR